MNSIETTKLGIIGLSHMGIVASVCLSELTGKIIACDIDNNHMKELSSKKLPIYEPKLDDLFKNNLNNLFYTSNFEELKDCNVVFLTLDIETTDENESLLTNLENIIDLSIPHLAQNVILVLMSQVPVGFTRNLYEIIKKKRKDLLFELYYCVETLVIGNAVERFMEPERMIVGCIDDEGIKNDRLKNILALLSCPIVKMSYESAELTKMAINLYLSASVTYANTLSDLCEKTGASMTEIIPALRLDKRIGQYSYIKPGLGISGGNLERDLINLQKLSNENQVKAGLIDYIIEYNTQRYKWVYNKIKNYILNNSQNPNPKVAVWGIAYKKDTKSTKNSFAIKVLNDFHEEINFHIYDPEAILPDHLKTNVFTGNKYEVLKDSEGLLILTDWDDFLDNDLETMTLNMKNNVIVDCVGIINNKEVSKAGFKCISMGEYNE